MRVVVVGTGYVGLVCGTCFAEMGNSVTCVDVDEAKISGLREGKIPIFEPGLEPMVKSNAAQGTLQFSTELAAALEDAQAVFIAVGTPMGEDGSADLSYVLGVARGIGKAMNRALVVVDKSTVPVGTAERVRDAIQQELDARGSTLDFDVVSNPEFLKEGAAIGDFMKPERVIVGTESAESLELLRELYAPFTMNHERFIAMGTRSAEMTKYAANAMLATKISFINEIANICERVGADVNQVRRGIGSDSRIGYQFIYPGCGYGGSCFPKDVTALTRTATEHGYTPRILDAVELVNKDQKQALLHRIRERFGRLGDESLEGLTFAVWGLAFKAGTDDMRESPALTLVEGLTAAGARVRAYDPKSIRHARTFWLKDCAGVEYFDSKYDALNGADAMVLITEWREFRSPDFDEMVKRLKAPLIFDGRNQYNLHRLARAGIEVQQIGVPSGAYQEHALAETDPDGLESPGDPLRSAGIL